MQRSRFARFLVAGGIAAVANVVSRYLFNFVVAYVPAIVLAYMVGMVTAFALNRRFVFAGATRPLHGQMLWFTLINIAALAQTLAVSVLLDRVVFPWMGWSWDSETCAHMVGVVVPVFTSYVGHRRLTFAGSNQPPS